MSVQKNEFLPENWEWVSSQLEEEMQKGMQQLKQGKKLRATFGDRRIEIPEELLEEIDLIVKQFKKQGFRDCSRSSIIRDALINYFFAIYSNVHLYPDYDPDAQALKNPRKLMERIVVKFPRKTAKKEIIEFTRWEYAEQVKHLSNKTLENYISEIRKADTYPNNFTEDSSIL